MFIEFHNGQLRIVDTPMHVDATERRPLSWISHAHADHAADHASVLATPPTCRLLQLRWKIDALQERAFFDPIRYGRYELELIPSGHMLGAAQLVVRSDGHTTVYTGDLGRPGMLTAEEVAVTACDDLIVDATYGRHDARYPPMARARTLLLDAVRSGLERADLVVVHAHRGRAQEAIAALLAAGHDVAATPAVLDAALVYQRYTTALDGVIPSTGRPRRGSVLVAPLRGASVAGGRAGRVHRIALSGMRADAASRSLNVDEVVPFVDHADFDELLDFVQRCRPRRVHTVHAGAVPLAEALRARGVRAQPLVAPDQLSLL
jgi:putative mRNA 3-end processing factor